ncbi:MAG: polysaccharide deacetylase family protein [Prolixibacteraceae bacterium]
MDPRIRLPQFLTGWFPEALWRGPDNENQIYLTFDDGPVPGVTPWVLDLLKREKVKACFFCVGENVTRYPDIYRRILEEGHLTGNHTYHHLQGMKTRAGSYLADVEKAAGVIDSRFFRPPHGLMRRRQYRQISKKYLVVMWDLVSCDYRQNVDHHVVTNNVLRYLRPGSIITFHDSYKSERNLYAALPVVIRELKRRGYRFGSLAELRTKPGIEETKKDKIRDYA